MKRSIAIAITVSAIALVVIIIVSICLANKGSGCGSSPLYYDVDVNSHPILKEVYQEFVKDIDAIPEPPGVQEHMSTPINKEIYEKSVRKPTLEELDDFEKVEQYLAKHHERPWKSLSPEQDVDKNWRFRFGKYIRKSETSPRFGKIISLIQQLDPSINLGGYFYYPKGGCREWHTNERDQLGWRGYFVYCPEGDNMSELNVLDPKTKEMTRIPDRSGIISLFKVKTGDDRLWHSITSRTKRYSLGFRLPDKVVDQLIGK